MTTPLVFYYLCWVGYGIIARATNGYIRATYPSMRLPFRIAWSLVWPVGFLVEVGRPLK